MPEIDRSKYLERGLGYLMDALPSHLRPENVREGYRMLRESMEPGAMYLSGARGLLGGMLGKLGTDIRYSEGEIASGVPERIMAGVMGHPVVNAMGGVLGQISPVYHGSPYKFTKFADEKIGTGEGAQAFGYGHYLTESPAVAKEYFRSNMRGYAPKVTFKGNDIYSMADELGLKNTYFDKDLAAIGQVAYNSKNIDDMIEAFRKALMNSKTPELKSQYQRILGAIEKNKGDLAIEGDNLYTATINKGKPSSADVFLEWDKLISEQPNIMKLLKDKIPPDEYNLPFDKMTGERVLAAVESKFPSQNYAVGSKDASDYLASLGITGIKYPTGTLSGIKGSDKYNYVVFDPKNITIEKINGRGINAKD